MAMEIIDMNIDPKNIPAAVVDMIMAAAKMTNAPAV